MAKTLQFKRYANTTLSSTTGADGELIIDANTRAITVHDGVTAGGNRMATESYVANSIGGISNALIQYAANTSNTDLTIALAAFNEANIAATIAQAAYNQANTPAGSIDTYARTTANNASSNTIYLTGIEASQNNNITAATTLAQAAFNLANTESSYVFAQSAANTANSASANTVYLQGGLNTANANVVTLFGISTASNGNIALLQGAMTSANANISLIFGIATTQNSSTNAAFSEANSANVLATSAFNIGFYASTTVNAAFIAANNAAQIIPQNAQSNNYVLANTDAGKHLYYTNASAVNLYIPWTSNTTYANGTTIIVVSHSSSNVIITPNNGVSMYLAGNTTSASRNVSTYGMATLLMTAANTWYINGTGVY